MLISLGNAGQFGNGYLSCAHRIADVIEAGYRAWLCDLGRYRPMLRSARPRANVRLLGPGAFWAGRVFSKAASIFGRRSKIAFAGVTLVREPGFRLDVPHAEITERARRGLVIHDGWLFRNGPALQRHADAVREALAFRPEFEQEAQARFDELKGGRRFVVGMHVRRGDYARFCDGRFLFDDSTYLRLAVEAVRALGDPGQTVVVGFSNERLQWPGALEGVPVRQAGGAWWSDFLCLSRCDVILGPPSTFSGAASFAGAVPWFQIKHAEAGFCLEQARVYPDGGIHVD
ncbi:MAG: hypothetical protein D6781_10275 [Verrucomicrobia bacterium]|nr:MAG: hypothetical protein D6781_10275 [Verrucomicrobiota bacterium]